MGAQHGAAHEQDGDDQQCPIAEIRTLFDQIYRWRNLAAITASLSSRYPDLVALLAALPGSDIVYADVLVRRELVTVGDTFRRTSDFDTIPTWIRDRWCQAEDNALTSAYMRYVAAGIGSAYTGPNSLAQMRDAAARGEV